MSKYQECIIYENPNHQIVLRLRRVYKVLWFKIPITLRNVTTDWEKLNFTLKLWVILFGKFKVIDRT